MRTLFLLVALATAGAARADLVDDLMKRDGYATREDAYAYFLTDRATSDDTLWLARRFAICNAAAWFVAGSLTSGPEQARDHYAWQVGNGARLAGTVLTRSAGYQREWYEGVLDARMSYWKSLFSTSPDDPALVSELEADMRVCNDVNMLQSAIVQSVREEMYRLDQPEGAK